MSFACGYETACLCVFVFVDNEAAEACWIAGFAQLTTARRVIPQGTLKEAAIDLHPFFARLPVHPDLGYDPSGVDSTN